MNLKLLKVQEENLLQCKLTMKIKVNLNYHMLIQNIQVDLFLWNQMLKDKLNLKVMQIMIESFFS